MELTESEAGMIEPKILDGALREAHSAFQKNHRRWPNGPQLLHTLRVDHKLQVRPIDLQRALTRTGLQVATIEVDTSASAESRLKQCRRAEVIEDKPPALSADDIQKLSPVARMQLARSGRVEVKRKQLSEAERNAIAERFTSF